MTTKERLLALLEAHPGEYLSGEEIAKDLSLSRTSVWKAIKSLQNQGYEIKAVSNKGYCLSKDTDILSKSGIIKNLDKTLEFMDISVVPAISSTNTVLKEYAEGGASEGKCIVAGFQSQGKGRRGRSFYSPDHTGAYFSILLRPKMYDLEKASNITTMAAVAVCNAIDDVSDRKAGIKWVNDVYIDEKKVCGILTEASLDMETGLCDYAVLGIGINIYPPGEDFPEDIKNIASSVFTESVANGKNMLVARTLNYFFKYYLDFDSNDYFTAYKEKSIILGKKIQVITPAETLNATALDIDEHCHLLVEYENGKRETLSSGEISIRPA